MKLEELQVFQLSVKLGEEVWAIVRKWDYFAKDTIGKQLVRAVDSIASNLSEGFSRYRFKENTNFSHNTRGSLSETKTWLTKAHNRKLISDEAFETLNDEIDNIGVKLNIYIRSIGKVSTINDN